MLTYKEIWRLLYSGNVYHAVKRDFYYKMKSFTEFPGAVDIVLEGCFKFHLLWRDSWNDECNTVLDVPVYVRYKVSLRPGNLKEYFAVIVKNLSIYLMEHIEHHVLQDVRYDLTSIELLEGEQLGISKLIAWNYCEVGIWYEEQECGEHWILLPRDPSEEGDPEYKIIGF